MIELLQDPSARIALLASGGFFLTGLLTGTWKYACIRSSPRAEAPVYVNIAHRAALMYAFAGLLLAVFAALSAFPDRVNAIAVTLPLVFFAIAVLRYVQLGIVNRTDNQHRDPPHPRLEIAFLATLAVCETGGFLVLFAGTLKTMVSGDW